jgi:hypothetical protein
MIEEVKKKQGTQGAKAKPVVPDKKDDEMK